MTSKQYIKELTKQINNPVIRREIAVEYMAHIDDQTEAYLQEGMSAKEAEEKAIEQMGSPEPAGKNMNKIYRKKVDWNMMLFFLIISAIAFIIRRITVNGLLEIQPILNYAAIAIAAVGFGICAMEKYFDMPLFYAWAENWNGGGITNSGLILGVSMFFMGYKTKAAAIWLIVLAVIMTAERYLIASARDRKEHKLLWEIGTAETEISYRGKGIIKGKRLRVKSDNNVVISKGDNIMVISLDGFTPIVVTV